MRDIQFSAYTENNWITFPENNINGNKHTYLGSGSTSDIPVNCSMNLKKTSRTGHITLTQLDGSTAPPIIITVVQEPVKTKKYTVISRFSEDHVQFYGGGVSLKDFTPMQEYPYLDGYYYATYEEIDSGDTSETDVNALVIGEAVNGTATDTNAASIISCKPSSGIWDSMKAEVAVTFDDAAAAMDWEEHHGKKEIAPISEPLP